MQRLIECLYTVESSCLLDDKETCLDITDHPLIDEILFIANRLFISDKGEPLFEEMDRLQAESTCYVFPGERDSCGWVTGCIQTKKGLIVFG